MSVETLVSFKSELRDLLLKYNATIEVGYDGCSDMHGVYGENITVSFDSSDRLNNTFELSNNWGIDASDLI